jgi:hypothetical protein
MLSRGNNHETMLTTVDTRTFQAETAIVVSALPCRHSFDEKPRPGALAGRCAR